MKTQVLITTSMKYSTTCGNSCSVHTIIVPCDTDEQANVMAGKINRQPGNHDTHRTMTQYALVLP